MCYYFGSDFCKKAKMYKENISHEDIMQSLDELIGRWSKEREASEAFGDFVVRVGVVKAVVDSAKDFYE